MILPELFVHRMRQMLDTEFDEFQHSFSNDIITTIRINPAKYNDRPGLRQVEYCKTGYFLPSRPLFTIDPFIHAGVYYVQESSSMFLEQVLRQIEIRSDHNVLDLCAAPGGKSTHLASLLPEGSLLVSNEVIRGRGQILSENLKKWGNPNVIVTNNDPCDFQRVPTFFDLMVIDAPCSGEGLFRRDENAISEWSPDNARLCAQRQQRILADAWPALKEGGVLIYSTCTFNPAENEENIEWLGKFADIEPIELDLTNASGVTVTDAGGIPCYRFYPHKMPGEGFFMAAVRKKGGAEVQRPRKFRENLLPASKQEKIIGGALIKDETLEVLKFEDALLAFPAGQLSELFQIKNTLRILHAGVKIGEIKQNDLLPSHELALSPILNRSVFPEIDLPIEEALNYLKREDISAQSPDRGWNLVNYRSVPLGWVKNVGNRFNSAFPKEWRIRMSVAEFKGERLRSEMEKFPL